MKTVEEAMDACEKRCRDRQFRPNTIRRYRGIVGKFAGWKKRPANHRKSLDDYLSEMAPRCAKATQALNLNALVFFYREVLGREVGQLRFKPARKPKRVPVCLTSGECHQLFDQMTGRVPLLQAKLMYGTGMRVGEMLALRIKDVDFGMETITVRGGKGDKDRVVPLPKSIRTDLENQVRFSQPFWETDQREGNPPPYLPDSLARKLGAQIAEFPWFWLFPARGLSTDPESGIIRRHHLTDRGVAKAIGVAARRAGLMKRVTPHVLRHSFASQVLLQGMDIKNLAELMGHATIRTTEIYLHVIPRLANRVLSPLDVEPSNVIPMRRLDQPGPEPERRKIYAIGH